MFVKGFMNKLTFLFW